MIKYRWEKLKDKTEVFYIGRYKVLEIYKRPHNGYCCWVYNTKGGGAIASNGYHGTALPKKYHAVRWGMKTLKELNMIE